MMVINPPQSLLWGSSFRWTFSLSQHTATLFKIISEFENVLHHHTFTVSATEGKKIVFITGHINIIVKSVLKPNTLDILYQWLLYRLYLVVKTFNSETLIETQAFASTLCFPIYQNYKNMSTCCSSFSCLYDTELCGWQQCPLSAFRHIMLSIQVCMI